MLLIYFKHYNICLDKLKDEGHNGVTILPTQNGYEVEKGTLFKYLGRAWSTAPNHSGEKSSGCFSAFSVPSRTPDPAVEIPRKYALPGWKVINSAHWYAYPLFSWKRVSFRIMVLISTDIK